MGDLLDDAQEAGGVLHVQPQAIERVEQALFLAAHDPGDQAKDDLPVVDAQVVAGLGDLEPGPEAIVGAHPAVLGHKDGRAAVQLPGVGAVGANAAGHVDVKAPQ